MREGLILKPLGLAYSFKRDRSWIKVKEMFTEDFKVIGFAKGDPRKKWKNTLGALVLDVNGVEVEGIVVDLHAHPEHGKAVVASCHRGPIDGTSRIRPPGLGQHGTIGVHGEDDSIEHRVSHVVDADDGDAILMAQKLSEELGLGVGISSGANFIGALKVQNELGPDSIVITVFADDSKKYLSTDLLREEPVQDGFLSPQVELLAFRALKRVCHTCCDPAECAKAEGDDIDQEHPLPYCPRRR